MRKTLISGEGERAVSAPEWLNLEKIAKVEITSEDEMFPIEHALGPKATTGWRASATGPQVLRLRFDEPQELRRIQLHFVERAAERMQEVALFVEMAGVGVQEILRQQFTFSPHGSTEEFEDFAVQLAHVTMLELRIDPDRSHDPKLSQSYASLTALRLA